MPKAPALTWKHRARLLPSERPPLDKANAVRCPRGECGVCCGPAILGDSREQPYIQVETEIDPSRPASRQATPSETSGGRERGDRAPRRRAGGAHGTLRPPGPAKRAKAPTRPPSPHQGARPAAASRSPYRGARQLLTLVRGVQE